MVVTSAGRVYVCPTHLADHFVVGEGQDAHLVSRKAFLYQKGKQQ